MKKKYYKAIDVAFTAPFPKMAVTHLVKVLIKKRTTFAQEMEARLTALIAKGAPSEQENVIKYGVELWDGIHKLIEIAAKEVDESKSS